MFETMLRYFAVLHLYSVIIEKVCYHDKSLFNDDLIN